MTTPSEFLNLFFADAEQICFRAIPPKTRPGEAYKDSGTIESFNNGSGLRSRLTGYNQQRGVYFVVNFGGDADHEIQRFNACFAEADNIPIPEQHRKLDECPLPTTARVETKRSVHAYWKLTGPVDKLQWRDVQLRLIAFFDGDRTIKNPSRVMRLPGFDHIDQDLSRTLVRVVQFSPERSYTIATMLAAFPPVPGPVHARKHSARQKVPGQFTTWDALRAALGRAIMDHESARKNNSGKWDCRGICHNGQGFTGLFYDERNNQAHCNSGCDQATILRAFGLPETPDFPIKEEDEAEAEAERDAIQNEPAVDNIQEAEETDKAEETEEAPDAEVVVRPLRYSDDALAELFTQRHQENFRFVPAWGWLRWDNTRWQRIADVVVMGVARLICREQAGFCIEDDDVSPRSRKSLARAVSSASTAGAVVKLASGDPRHLAKASDFDADPWAFNTPGGTINLKTGKIQDHCQEDLITKIANATPKGHCPLWLSFLMKVTNEKAELQSYLQRLLGYALTGDPSEECLDFFFGTGANGKGTLLTTCQHVFGEYATTAASETFLESKGERHPADIAKLAGARLVIAQEVDEGQAWNESRVKTMTGRDMMTARFMRRDYFDFLPQFTLIISGNNKPALKNVDHAWQRRLHLVPFGVTIPPEEQDADLKRKLRDEADGILKWIVDGCLSWQKQRLSPPEIVLAATTDTSTAKTLWKCGWRNVASGTMRDTKSRRSCST